MKNIFGSLILLFCFLMICACNQVSSSPLPSTQTPNLQLTNQPSSTSRQPSDQTPTLPPLPSPSFTPAMPTLTMIPESPTITPTPLSPTLAPAKPSPTSTPQPLTPTPEPLLVTATPGISGTLGCEDKAAFFSDVTVPDNTAFDQGVTFVKTWQVRNEGTCTWGTGYALVFAAGDQLSGPQSLPLSQTVEPGQMTNLSVTLTTPKTGGIFLGDWMLANSQGTHFGFGSGGYDLIWVKISVSYFPPGQVPATSQAPSTSATPASGSATCVTQLNPQYEAQVLELMNQARQAQGLPTLTLDNRLTAAARGHSIDMACNGFVDHRGSDGTMWGDRMKAQGYHYSNAEENMYVGDPAFGGTAQGAFDWWMNSPVHHANIMSAKVTQVGIGYVYAPNSQWKGYYTVDFGRL